MGVSRPSYLNGESASLLSPGDGGHELEHNEPFCTPNRYPPTAPLPYTEQLPPPPPQIISPSFTNSWLQVYNDNVNLSGGGAVYGAGSCYNGTHMR